MTVLRRSSSHLFTCALLTAVSRTPRRKLAPALLTSRLRPAPIRTRELGNPSEELAIAQLRVSQRSRSRDRGHDGSLALFLSPSFGRCGCCAEMRCAVTRRANCRRLALTQSPECFHRGAERRRRRRQRFYLERGDPSIIAMINNRLLLILFRTRDHHAIKRALEIAKCHGVALPLPVYRFRRSLSTDRKKRTGQRAIYVVFMTTL